MTEPVAFSKGTKNRDETRVLKPGLNVKKMVKNERNEVLMELSRNM